MAETARRKRHWVTNLWRNWIKPLAIVAAILFPFRSSIADWNDVPSGSMNPTIVEGDRIFVNKLAYELRLPFTQWTVVKWSQPQRGDIVTFWSPVDGTRLVKRVVAVPGDRVAMLAGRLKVNGNWATYTRRGQQRSVLEQSESFGRELRQTQLTLDRPVYRSFAELQLASGEYWVMGDNRDNSRDSRFFGPVSERQIAGQALAVAFSLDRRHGYAPRWDRFFHGLK